jgi:hypothetical protein
MLLHGLYSLPVGTTVDHNTQIGTESNIGYTIDMDGNSCKGRDCGYHSHLNITDLAGNNLNPLEYFKDRPVSGVVAQAPQVNIVQDQGGGTSIAPLFTKEVQHWAPQIVNWSAQHGLDPNLVATVMQIESCGDPQAHSPADARGLFQIVPKWHPASCDYFDPECNAALGMKYLQVLMANYPNDPGRVFAAYNGGITGTKGSYDTWPAEAQRYYRWGTGIYKDAQSGSTTSETLNQWLAAGGASLCQQAAARLGLNP